MVGGCVVGGCVVGCCVDSFVVVPGFCVVTALKQKLFYLDLPLLSVNTWMIRKKGSRRQ